MFKVQKKDNEKERVKVQKKAKQTCKKWKKAQTESWKYKTKCKGVKVWKKGNTESVKVWKSACEKVKKKVQKLVKERNYKVQMKIQNKESAKKC